MVGFDSRQGHLSCEGLFVETDIRNRAFAAEMALREKDRAMKGRTEREEHRNQIFAFRSEGWLSMEEAFKGLGFFRRNY